MSDRPLATVPQLDPGDVVWPGMSFEQWRAQAPKLGRLVRGVQWLAVTWLLHGERSYGERFAQAVAELGLQEHSIMNMLAVARAFPDPARRHPALTFSHHEALAGLDDTDAQERWLTQAEQEGWSVSRLRQELRGAKVVPSRDDPKRAVWLEAAEIADNWEPPPELEHVGGWECDMTREALAAIFRAKAAE